MINHAILILFIYAKLKNLSVIGCSICAHAYEMTHDIPLLSKHSIDHLLFSTHALLL